MTFSTPVTTESRSLYSISWPAIFVGALFAVGIGFLFHLLNAGLGLSAYTTSPSGLTTLAIGGFIWLVICAFISMFIAGFITGKLIRAPAIQHRNVGIIHGFAAWSLAFIILVVLAAHAGFLIASSANQGLGDNFAQISPISTLHAPVRTEGNVVPRARTAVTTPSQTVVVDTEKATNSLGVGILATFFIFLTGAIAACVGSVVGMRHHDDVVEVRERKREEI